MTQLCTLAVFHSGTILDMDGGIFKTRVSSSLISLTPLSITSLQSSLAGPPPSFVSLCLSIHFSSLLSSLHLPGDLTWGRMSYVVYESSIYLVGSARAGSPCISVTVLEYCMAAMATACTLYIITDYLHCKGTYLFHNSIRIES